MRCAKQRGLTLFEPEEFKAITGQGIAIGTGTDIAMETADLTSLCGYE